MKLTWGACCFVFLSVAVHQLTAVPPATKPVTNEDIRDAILSILHMMRSLEDKLDRHEFRERALGQDFKKNFSTLEKRIKGLESIKGATQRLDQRVANVETVLMEKGDRERTQLQGTFDSVNELKKRIPDDIDKLRSHIDGKLSNMSKSAGIIEAGFEKLAKDNDVLKKANAASIESMERTKKQLSSSELLLQQYEHKLTEFNDKIHTDIVPIDYKDETVTKELQENKALLNKVVDDVSTLKRRVDNLPDKDTLNSFGNDTARVVNELLKSSNPKEQLEAVIKPEFTNLLAQLKNQGDVLDSLNELKEQTANMTSGMGRAYEDLKKEVGSLPKVEEILVQTAEGLMDTKRRIEYAVHEIKGEVKHLIKEHGDKINGTIHDRFDTFELNILDGETGALANLTSKIGQDIDQVWRQIGIMHQQMSASTDTLNKLQNQTDSYVSGSLNVMDSMKGKVGQITSRMTEVDENLNYLMGRLSLVTQEFNGIKGGLGKALDEIRTAFMAVKKNVDDVKKVDAGAGPHNITSAEVPV